MPKNYKLIFIIVHHPILGYIVEAYRIAILSNNQWSEEIKKVVGLSSQYLNFQISSEEEMILKMLRVTQEDTVYAHFSLLKEKKITSNNTYFTEQTIAKHLVPYVSKHTADILNTLIDFGFPIYYKTEDKGIIQQNHLQIEFENAEPRFYFNLSQQTFQYQLSVYHHNERIDISQIKILTQSPCFIRLNGQLMMMPKNFDGQLLKPFQKTETIHIPKDKVKQYLQTFVSKIIQHYRAEVNGFTLEEHRPDPKAVLGISKIQRKTPVVELTFQYSDVLFFPHSTQEFTLKLNTANEQITFCKIFRNHAKEKILKEQLLKAGLIEVQQGYFLPEQYVKNSDQLTVSQLIYELSERAAHLQTSDIVFNVNFGKNNYVFHEPLVSSNIQLNNSDWFDLKINVAIGKFTIPFQKFIPNIQTGNREFRLPDGSITILPLEWFSRFKDLSLLSGYDDNNLKIHKSQINLLYCVDEKCQKYLTEKLKSFVNRQIPAKKAPCSLKASLREYQQRGFEWLVYMQECGLGGCLADDMGLGKTIQVLAYFLHIRENSNGHASEKKLSPNGQLCLFDNIAETRFKHTHLIIAPLSLLHNWQDEILRFAPELKTILYTGADRFRLYHNFKYADIVLTSYGIVRNDYDVLKHFDFHTIVLDESQFIKNPDSKSYDSLLTLNSKQRFVLTGTPIENSLTDIWTQMNFLNPNMLGSLKTFKETYVIPVEKNNDEQVSKRIQKLVGTFILRRTKNEVTPELPPITEKICYCTMSEQQKSIYEKKKSEIRNFLIENSSPSQRSRRNIIALSGLMKLRLIANHPKLTDACFSGESGKFEEIIQHIEKSIAEGNKTIIFSQFIKHLNIFKEYLDSRNIGYEMLTGQTSNVDRQKNIFHFKNNDDIKLFLMTLKAGGVGLNLTEADYVFIIDPWWNPAAEKQAINRTHRIGQDKKIFSYKFITKETIEEKIMMLQQKKSDLFNSIINSSTFAKLSEEELITLFD